MNTSVGVCACVHLSAGRRARISSSQGGIGVCVHVHHPKIDAYVCMYVCMHMYYIYIYTHTHTNVYIHVKQPKRDGKIHLYMFYEKHGFEVLELVYIVTAIRTYTCIRYKCIRLLRINNMRKFSCGPSKKSTWLHLFIAQYVHTYTHKHARKHASTHTHIHTYTHTFPGWTRWGDSGGDFARNNACMNGRRWPGNWSRIRCVCVDVDVDVCMHVCVCVCVCEWHEAARGLKGDVHIHAW
jgi:hypothetical protein